MAAAATRAGAVTVRANQAGEGDMRAGMSMAPSMARGARAVDQRAWRHSAGAAAARIDGQRWLARARKRLAKAGRATLAGGGAGQLLEQGVAFGPEQPAELGPGCPVAPVDPLPPGGEDEAELGGVGQVEELVPQLGQLEQPALGLGEPAGVAQRAQQGGAPPGQGQAVGAVAAGPAAGEPLPDRAQAGGAPAPRAGEGQALVGQAGQELADVVGEAAERAGEQHGWGLASWLWVGCVPGSRFGTARACLERPGATLGLPHVTGAGHPTRRTRSIWRSSSGSPTAPRSWWSRPTSRPTTWPSWSRRRSPASQGCCGCPTPTAAGWACPPRSWPTSRSARSTPTSGSASAPRSARGGRAR